MDTEYPEEGDRNAEQEPQPVGDGGQFTQRIKHQQLSARVPDGVADGIMASGSLVLTGPHEFTIDFLQTLTRPHRVAARIILPPSIMPNVVRALKQNVENFAKRFGAPPELPKPPQNAKPPSIEEIYDQLKLTDEVACGVYANTMMVTHSASEFCFDFITGFYPRSTVAKRIFMSVPQVPRLADTLSRSWDQYQQKVRAAQQRQRQDRPPDDMPGLDDGTRLA